MGKSPMIHIPFSTTLSVGGLADSTVLVADILSDLVTGLYVHSVTAALALRDATPGQGPVEVGYAHGDLTTTEIKENLTVNLADPDNIIGRERARRPVRKVGIFPSIAADDVMNNGIAVKRACRFKVGIGKDFKFFAYNRSGVTLSSGQVTVDGTIHGRWLGRK